MTGWIAMGRDGAGVTAHAMQGATLIRSARGTDEAAALAHLDFDASRTVHIGDGAPDGIPTAVLPTGGARLPALTQDTPPDVIGAWVRIWIAGALADRPNWDGVICAAQGDVRHWIHVSANEVVSCQSTLTPRLAAALEGATPPDEQALADSLSRPERLAAHLRAAEVSGNRAAITGHLIGAELAATRPYWLGQEVILISPDGTASGLETALAAQGVPVGTLAADGLLPAGLATLASAFGLAD
ncbi:2-dehydro-3-deoxygalactonokinase [Roseovarius pacificus]|uniref:2-dehydro-3-deoxygalactonokinase n=1 Tax=Roseovarius pacificus TaxID=337701 RepID=UPI004039D9A1